MASGMGHGSGEFGEVQLNDIGNLIVALWEELGVVIQTDGFLRQNLPTTLPCNV